MGKPKFCVIDLETTGLDANEDVPLEVACILIDAWGEEIAHFTSLIMEDNRDYERGLDRGRSLLAVDSMHTKSGLWEDLHKNRHKALPRWEVENRLVKWLETHGVSEKELPMLGSSIGSLDRPFCIVHLPVFNDFLSYRNVDVSTLKEVCKATNPILYDNLLPLIGTKKDAAHRALDDARASINEYKVYLEEFLITEEN